MLTATTLRAGMLAALLAMAAGIAGARELRVADTHPPDYPTVQALDHMGRLLAERSDGRLTLRVLHSRMLGEEKETIEQARVGALDLARVNLVPLNAMVPETVVPSLPFLFRSREHMARVLDGPVGQDILNAFERQGFVGLAFYDSGARSFYTWRHPIRVPADLKGLRIRVQQSPLAEAMVEALGAVPTPLPYGQVGVALRTQVIDGAENNWPSYQDARHYEAARYYSLTEHVMAPEVLLMSKKVWDRLPPADRRLVRQAARDSAVYMRTLWEAREAAARDQVRDGGAEINTVDKAAFVDAVKPVYARFAATPAIRELVRRAQAVE